MQDGSSNGSGRSTLKEIARLAGVSVSTASVVLAGKATVRRISPEVERRVREVAAQQDYSPNLLVRAMQQGRTHVLSFYSSFGHRDLNDLYMDRLSTAIERAAGACHYDVLVHCDFSRPADEMYRMLNGGRSDGLIFFGPTGAHPLLRLLRSSRLPVVLLNQVDEEGVLSSVSDDMQDGMRQVADELVALGHRRIGAVIGLHPGPDALPRVAALRARLAAHGISLPDEWLITEREVGTLLTRPEPPTALFCWHDRAGYATLEECERLGIAVPEQLSFIGYDGLQWPSTSPHVLASVDVDLDTLAEAAVRLLDRLIQGEVEAPACRVFPVKLSRGTTLAPPSRK